MREAELTYRSALIVAALRAYMEDRDARRAAGKPEYPVQPVTADGFNLDASLSSKTLDPVTPEQWVSSRLKDPVRNTLKGVVRDEGWKAFAKGRRDALDVLFAEVEQQYPRGAAALDKWWDGIGDFKRGLWLA